MVAAESPNAKLAGLSRLNAWKCAPEGRRHARMHGPQWLRTRL